MRKQSEQKRVRSTEEEKREDNLGKQFLMCLMEVQKTLRCKRREMEFEVSNG